jgi:Lon protease-like protein
VTLISRGAEVGGGDERTMVGVIARIVEAVEFDDGRWAIGAVSTSRIQVTGWLSDEPYPRALVEQWPDGTGEAIPDALVATLVDLLAVVTAMARVLGEPVAQSISELPIGASELSFALSSASPLGSADRYDLLCAEGPLERLEVLERRLRDQQVLYGARIAMEQA